MPRLRTLSLALATVSLVTTASCGRIMHRGSDELAQVVFVNQSLDQADVFVVSAGGQSQRIGTVFGGRTETLSVPSTFVSGATTVNIVARLLAHTNAPRTGPITLSPGESVQVTLPSSANTLTILPGP